VFKQREKEQKIIMLKREFLRVYKRREGWGGGFILNGFGIKKKKGTCLFFFKEEKKEDMQ